MVSKSESDLIPSIPLLTSNPVNRIVSNNRIASFFIDEGNELVRKEAQQDAHVVPALRHRRLPRAEEDLRAVRLPRRKDPQIQLVGEGAS